MMVRFKGELIILCHAYLEISMYLKLNCWKFLKLYILQHKDEISLSVNVTKVEKNI